MACAANAIIDPSEPPIAPAANPNALPMGTPSGGEALVPSMNKSTARILFSEYKNSTGATPPPATFFLV